MDRRGDLKRQTAKSQAEFLAECGALTEETTGEARRFSALEQAQDWLEQTGEALFQKKEENQRRQELCQKGLEQKETLETEISKLQGSLRGSGKTCRARPERKQKRKTQQEEKAFSASARGRTGRRKRFFGSALETRKEIMEWFSAQLVEAEQKKKKTSVGKKAAKTSGRACALPAGDRTVPQERAGARKKIGIAKSHLEEFQGNPKSRLRSRRRKPTESWQSFKNSSSKTEKVWKEKKVFKRNAGSWKKKKTPARMQYKGLLQVLARTSAEQNALAKQQKTQEEKLAGDRRSAAAKDPGAEEQKQSLEEDLKAQTEVLKALQKQYTFLEASVKTLESQLQDQEALADEEELKAQKEDCRKRQEELRSLEKSLFHRQEKTQGIFRQVHAKQQEMELTEKEYVRVKAWRKRQEET